MHPNVGSPPFRSTAEADIVCLSHLRWNFVFQRPQHLMTRLARSRRVFFVEEPVYHDEGGTELRVTVDEQGVLIAVPHLPKGLADAEATVRGLVDGLLREHRVTAPVLWYYTPMALNWSRGLVASAVVYDCMDELTMFRGAPRLLGELEAELLDCADLVFTGGQSLYEVKRDRHHSVHCFPSSIERAHFDSARELQPVPEDQAAIGHPRLGFFGVLDERFDAELVGAVAAARPEWQIVLLGPVVKIDPAELPRGENLHYLGMKRYEELPAYLAGWDVALLPFARNDSTRFISPTKTPEYLAGGKPVVSTSIRDVVRPYGERGLVEIADDPAAFVAAVERLLARTATERDRWIALVDQHLVRGSWSETVDRMAGLIAAAVRANAPSHVGATALTARTGGSLHV